jgi:hypothetical protein
MSESIKRFKRSFVQLPTIIKVRLLGTRLPSIESGTVTVPGTVPDLPGDAPTIHRVGDRDRPGDGPRFARGRGRDAACPELQDGGASPIPDKHRPRAGQTASPGRPRPRFARNWTRRRGSRTGERLQFRTNSVPRRAGQTASPGRPRPRFARNWTRRRSPVPVPDLPAPDGDAPSPPHGPLEIPIGEDWGVRAPGQVRVY